MDDLVRLSALRESLTPARQYTNQRCHVPSDSGSRAVMSSVNGGTTGGSVFRRGAIAWRSRAGLRHFGAGRGTGETTPSRARGRGDRKDFHRAAKSGAATKVANRSKMPVMRLER